MGALPDIRNQLPLISVLVLFVGCWVLWGSAQFGRTAEFDGIDATIDANDLSIGSLADGPADEALRTWRQAVAKELTPHVPLPPQRLLLPPMPADAKKRTCDLLILVLSKDRSSGPDAAERRQSVRMGWGSYLRSQICVPCQQHRVRVLFVADTGDDTHAMDLHAEASRMGDVAVINGLDEQPRPLRLLTSIAYAVAFFEFRLLLRVQDDAWVFMDRLLERLSPSLWNVRYLYGGFFPQLLDMSERSHPGDDAYVRSTGLSMFPRYAKGTSFLLSRDVCEFLVQRRQAHWLMLSREDRSLGLWLHIMNYTRARLSFWSGKVAADPSRAACGPFQDKALVYQPVTLRRAHDIWKAYNTGRGACSNPPES